MINISTFKDIALEIVYKYIESRPIPQNMWDNYRFEAAQECSKIYAIAGDILASKSRGEIHKIIDNMAFPELQKKLRASYRHYFTGMFAALTLPSIEEVDETKMRPT